MAWVKTIEPDAAKDLLKDLYQAAQKRLGYVPNIAKVQSLRPETMRIGVSLYRQLMDAPTGISFRQRVFIATVVSKANGCYY